MALKSSKYNVRGARQNPKSLPRKPIPSLPWLPIADEEPTPLLDATLRGSMFPPLMKDKSLTKSVPYKDGFEYLRPTDTIGSCYNTSINAVRLYMVPEKRKSKPTISCLDEKGNLTYPPKLPRLEPQKPKKTAAQRHRPGVVKLSELLSGEYDLKRAKKEERRKQRVQKKQQEEKQRQKDKLEAEARKLASMEAILPVHPDIQKAILKEYAEKECNKTVNPEDWKRIYYYIFQGITDEMIEPFKEMWLIRAKKKIKILINKRLEVVLEQLETQVKDCYTLSQRIAILDYILLDPLEKQRLNITTYPVRYPALTIRAPVPWHQAFITSSQKTYYSLYIGHPMIHALRELWNIRYSKMLILPVAEMEEAGFPMLPEKWNTIVQELCEHSRNILIEKWLVECAEIILEYRESWRHLVPRQKNVPLLLIERLFACANALLSLQLRSLVMKSLKHFLQLITKYKNGNTICGDYQDLMFVQKPLVTVKVIPQQGSTVLQFQPPFLSLRLQVKETFLGIVKVNQDIPQLERYLFPELNTNNYLLSVKPEEEEVEAIISEALEAFDTNTPGPQTFLEIYNDYLYILSGEAQESLDKFFKTEPFPYLKVASYFILHSNF